MAPLGPNENDLLRVWKMTGGRCEDRPRKIKRTAEQMGMDNASGRIVGLLPSCFVSFAGFIQSQLFFCF